VIPISLRISGFLSYYQPVEINFEAFDLACITGSNGAGKSSLLDALTWAIFGEARRRDDSIINHQANAAEVRFEFLYESGHYCIQRSKARDKATVLEFTIRSEDGVWRPLTEPTLRATEEIIHQTLRLDYETFVNTSFFLQGKADMFAQQRPGDRKRILASILGLDVWESYKEEATRRRRNNELELANVEGVITEIESELQEEDSRKARLAQAEADYGNAKKLLDARKLLLDQQRLIQDRVKNEQRTLEKQAAELNTRRADLESLKSRLVQRKEEQDLFKAQLDHEKQIRSEFERWQEARKSLEKWESLALNFHQFEQQRSGPQLKIESEKNRLALELANFNKLRQKADELAASLPDLNTQFKQFQAEVELLSKRMEMRPILEEELRSVQGAKADALAENAQLKQQMTELKDRIEQLEETTGAQCPLCGKPLEPEERKRLVEQLKQSGKEMGNTYRNNQAVSDKCDRDYREKETQLLSLQRTDAELKLQQRLLDGKQVEIKGVEEEVAAWKEKGIPQLEQLQQKIELEDFAPEDREALKRIDEQLKAIGYDAVEHENRRQADLALRGSQERVVELEKARSALQPLEREIEELAKSVQVTEENLLKLEEEHAAALLKLGNDMQDMPDLKVLEKEYYEVQEQSNQLLRSVGYARNQVDVLVQQREALGTHKEEREAIKAQIANLRTLEHAFGKDGIPALLIEQALPEIETHANEILDRLSSGEMSVSFETQRLFKDKKRDDRKETLDIVIQDAAGKREYELFSGGEAFRINFAIRLALSRVLSHRAGARLQTLVIDEGFGSQDADGRQRLVEAITLVLPEFAKIMVITHLEELKDAFPARIEVTKMPKGSQVEVLLA